MAMPDLPTGAPAPLAEPFFLGPSPPARVEEALSYATLVTRLAAAVPPSDIPEQIWLREVADNMWEVARLRRLKVSTVAGAAEEGLRLLLVSLGIDSAGPLAARWAARDATAIKAVDVTLARAELDMEHIMAQALCLRLDEVERLDRLEGDALARRAQAIREVGRHRAQFAEALRRAALAADQAAAREGGRAAPQPEARQ
jgi:hypothetical protein